MAVCILNTSAIRREFLPLDSDLCLKTWLVLFICNAGRQCHLASGLPQDASGQPHLSGTGQLFESASSLSVRSLSWLKYRRKLIICQVHNPGCNGFSHFIYLLLIRTAPTTARLLAGRVY